MRTATEEPLFPRYLLIRLDADGTGQSWAPIRSTKGVSQMVTFGGEPAKVSETLVAALRQREAEEPRPLFAPGERLTIGEGPFAGLDAVYEMPDGDRRAMVLIEILGKNRAPDGPARNPRQTRLMRPTLACEKRLFGDPAACYRPFGF